MDRTRGGEGGLQLLLPGCFVFGFGCGSVKAENHNQENASPMWKCISLMNIVNTDISQFYSFPGPIFDVLIALQILLNGAFVQPHTLKANSRLQVWTGGCWFFFFLILFLLLGVLLKNDAVGLLKTARGLWFWGVGVVEAVDSKTFNFPETKDMWISPSSCLCVLRPIVISL